MITVEPACAADVEALYRCRPGETLRAVVVKLDGKPAGIIGLAKEADRDRLFSEYKDELAPHLHSMTILRAIKMVMSWVESSRVPVYAIAENPQLLERLGFQQIAGEVYAWHS
jgi:hypothetical protein